MLVWSLFLPLLLFFSGETTVPNSSTKQVLPARLAVTTAPNPIFHPLMADGFDFPIGSKSATGHYTDKVSGIQYSGWYIAAQTGEEYELGIHTGEDWNGRGGNNTDLGQPVKAIGKGKVVAADNYGAPWGNVIMIEHHYMENAEVKRVFSLYAHLEELSVSDGDTVERRQLIGSIGTGDGAYLAHLHLELRSESLADFPVDYWPSAEGKDQKWVKEHYLAPTPFIQAHRRTSVPIQAKHCLVVTKHQYRLEHWRQGELMRSYDIALSQDPLGHKQRQGDNRLPEGAYHINQKSRGPFSGTYGDFFGPAWMRISYPNVWDAKAGVAAGTISEADGQKIEQAWDERKMPPKTTDLGGGIGIHGWSGTWNPDGDRHLTWGCISMQNEDLDQFYDKIPVGTLIFIYP